MHRGVIATNEEANSST